METWDAMGRGLKAGCEGVHLVSYHSLRRVLVVELVPQSSTWLDFNTIQSGTAGRTRITCNVAMDYSLTPVKPTLDMESRYENHPGRARTATRRIDAHQVREAAYWAVLAGAAGHGYGCNDIWQMHDDKKVDSALDYSFPLIPPTTNWATAMDFDGAFGVGYMRRLMELRPWYRMVPDQSVIAAGQGEGEDHVQAARAQDGSFILAYLPFGNPVSIHMDRISGGNVKAQWYDPRKGTFMPDRGVCQQGRPRVRRAVAGQQDDWVLVLDDAARGYPSD